MVNSLLICAVLLFNNVISGQDLTQIGKAKLLNISGGLSANTVFYDGNSLRDPFTYVLNGNVNFNFSGVFNVPLSFTYSNQEFNFSRPFNFNRLSIHPSYKWVTAHIGDVSMSFSPYTLNGHQFSGLGVDLTPNGKFKISAMYGRLINPVEYNFDATETVPAYKRVGYGLKASYDLKSNTTIGITFFNAKDETNSLSNEIPIDIGVAPKENLVISLEAAIKPVDKLEFSVEYATSAVTEDINTPEFIGAKGPLSFLFNEKLSTSYYTALNANIRYNLGNGNIGAGYERIDPDYKTFGAYFFNNDFENITMNASQSLFNNKLSLSINAGLQSDNLDKTKKSELKRIVTAINTTLTASDKFNITASYSNFQSYTNIRSQFDYINAISEYDTLDDLNFKQLSQNANLSMSYVLSKKDTKNQNVNFNLSFQDTKDIQEVFLSGVENTVGDSQFYNSALAYSLTYPESTLSISAAFNATLNKLMDINSIAMGPTLVVRKQLFNKTVKTSLSSSYNTSSTEGVKQNSILNFRFNAGCQLKEKHQLNLSALSLIRNGSGNSATDFTVTLGYSYSFSTSAKKKTKKREQINNQKNVNPSKDNTGIMKIRFRKRIFEGNTTDLLHRIQVIRSEKSLAKMPLIINDQIEQIKQDILLIEPEYISSTKNKVIDYLEAVYNYKDFIDAYNGILLTTAIQLNEETNRFDFEIERKFTEAISKINSHKFKGQDPELILDKKDPKYNDYIKIHDNFISMRQKFVAHRMMLEHLNTIKKTNQFDSDELLKDFKQQQLIDTFNLYKMNTDQSTITNYLITQMIIYYQNIVKQKSTSEDYILKYIQK